MATEKQVAANFRNARRSTGPRTTAGKTRSAQNSFKHGLLATPALLPDENAEAFRAFARERIRALDPVGPLERDLAEQIAFQLWRLKRFPRIEAGLFINDRAGRDQDYFSSQAEECRTVSSEGGQEDQMFELMQRLRGKVTVEITDEERYADAMEKVSAASDARRSELALLGLAFSSAAVNGDPFGKVSRYETAAHNRLHRLIDDLDRLQTRRKTAQPESAGEEPSVS